MIEVVIPAFNGGRFLRETLLSVASQTVPPARVTIVDDRSTDDTVAVAEACGRELAGRLDIRLIANTGPQGPSAARNTAIKQSDAVWIALLDADDLLTPIHHERLLQAAQALPGAVLSFGDSTVFRDDPDGTRHVTVAHYLAVSGVSALPATELPGGSLTLGEAMFGAMLRNGVFGTSACLIGREAAISVGLFDESMMHSEDTDLFLRLALAGGFAFTRDVVANKRVHGNNLSHERHKFAFCRGTARSLTKLAGEAGNLTPKQAQALDGALTVAIDNYLYHASLAGLVSYRDAATLSRRSGRGSLAAKPKHLLRLAMRRRISV
jgi:glycosyltransferase involved in cell wall biosynthesis